MPLIRRIPKRGFNNAAHTTRYIPVNLGDLSRFNEGEEINEASLRKSGLANGKGAGVKILSGGGDLKKKLTISAHAFSAAARQKIEAAGGSCKLLGKPEKPSK